MPPLMRGKGGRASTYDVVTVVPQYIAHLTAADSDGSSAAVSRQRVTIARAQLLELQHARASATVIALEAAKREAFSSARVIREGVLNMPARVSGVLAADADQARVFELLDHELRLSLSAIADLRETGDAT